MKMVNIFRSVTFSASSLRGASRTPRTTKVWNAINASATISAVTRYAWIAFPATTVGTIPATANWPTQMNTLISVTSVSRSLGSLLRLGSIPQ